MPDTDVNIDFDHLRRTVPGCLRGCRQWVAWTYEERGGKRTKVPISPTKDGRASSTNSATWGSFAQAATACCRCTDLAGIGFVFSPDDPYAGIDLDNCIDGAGQIKTWAVPIIRQLDSYSETSPSGKGVKVFLRARKMGPGCSRSYKDGKVEIYDRARFFTVTGQRLDDVSAHVEERQTELEAVYGLVFGADRPARTITNTQTPDNGRRHLDDHEIIKIALRSKKSGEKFQALWEGRWQEHFGSQSEGDASLVCRLTFYTKDTVQIDRLFRRSGLIREKWDERHGAQTYGEMTIASALDKVTSQYMPRNVTMSRRITAQPHGERTLPEIITTDVQLRDLTDLAVDALTRSGDPPVLFVRSGSLVRITEDEKHVPRIEKLERAHMRCRLTGVANFYVLKRAGDAVHQVSVAPPLALAENILVLGSWPFQPLAGLARAPIIRADGSICMTPGYDAESQLFYVPDPELKLSKISQFPNINEVHDCVDILLTIIEDFPFANTASKANAMSVLFSVLLRPVIKGHIPLAIFDAPVQGTGKTLLVTVLVHIAVGSVASESVPAKLNEDEWRKKITSVLMASTPVILLDNIPDNTAIDSPMLAAALTSHEWSDRVLGRNETVRLPSKAIWIATGNNLQVGGDMPRRCYTIRLDAEAERPWERSGFHIADLEDYVHRNRGELLAAALTIVRGWFAAKCPRAEVRPFGSFNEWADIVGSVMAYAGIDGFLDNLDRTWSVQDQDTRQWRVVFDAWWEKFGDKIVTVAELVAAFFLDDAANPIDIPDALLIQKDRGDGSLRRSLGKHLVRLTGRIFNERKLCDAGAHTHNKVRAWTLRPVHQKEIEGGNPANPANCGVSFDETPQRE